MDYLADAPLGPPEPSADDGAVAKRLSTSPRPFPSTYLQRVRAFPMLGEAEEQRLTDRWYRLGDRRAFDALIASHLRLVPRIAQRYAGYGILVTDLIGEGNLGLLQSANRFDPARGFRFSTYARWWIKTAILNHILQSWSLIKIGHGAAKKRMFFNLRRAKARLGGDGQRYLSDANIALLAERFQVSREDVIAMDQRLSGQDLSLHQPEQGHEGLTVADLLATDAPNPEEAALQSDEARHRSRALRAALRRLDRREGDIVTRRYLADTPVTLGTLADRYGITPERVRQIEARAISKLRHLLESLT